MEICIEDSWKIICIMDKDNLSQKINPCQAFLEKENSSMAKLSYQTAPPMKVPFKTCKKVGKEYSRQVKEYIMKVFSGMIYLMIQEY